MSEKMNFLFIMTDQHRADCLSSYGHPILKTPNIDSIASGGVRFTNYFCNTPICMPNRANFFTGSYPSVHGVRSNGINLNPTRIVFSEILRKKGYHTTTVGKHHFNYFSRSTKKDPSLEDLFKWLHGDLTSKDVPSPWYGFEDALLAIGHGDVMAGHYHEWVKEKGFDMHAYMLSKPQALNENYYETPLSEELYPTTYITDKTVEAIQQHAEGKNGDKPFFLHCSFPDPHHPACPPGKYKDMFKPEDIELPSNFGDAKNLLDHEFLGPHIKDARFRQLLPQMVDEQTAREFTALTYGAITMIDDGVGRILSALKKSGLVDNTMVMFTSDHGDYMGDHGVILKGPAHYRGVINMPLLWKVPGLTKTSVSDSLVCTVDLPRTILPLLGVPERQIPLTFQGVNVAPILKDPEAKVRDRILIEHDEELAADKIMRVHSLVTEQHRLTIYNEHETMGDLFDLKSDPDEVNNLWNSDVNLRNELVDKLLRETVKIRPRYPKRIAFN